MILSKKRKGDVTNVAGHRKREARALKRLGVKGVEIRKPDQLQNVSSLIIPGGESTTMARLAEYHNLFPALREFVKMGKPVWGTCAGQKLGGQELVGGLDCTVHRNFFGSQIQSFEAELSVPALASQEGGPETFRGVFIRAPAVLDVGPDVDVLADYPVPSNKVLYSSSTVEIQEENAMPEKKVIVAVRQGNLLGTAFHPELTADTRWHSYFLKMMSEVGEGTSSGGKGTSSGIVVVGGENLGFNQQPKIDLPIFQ
ncbi:putative pyridoxal 5'-phosphate synthase subunit PDX2 [Citrus sinensis]|uniref:Pyridoxal 5'-phosphate synthase subunit PDX2 n=1 Tax=Citrus sinensis TaxID=2711 RepID=A0ACB8IUB9_CITSI|nr:putative pyridoxal 5'-phosphate synthase subunit PDX2 [Citrus sinensis]KAH9700697.1 putative pyridoxal 5'-phosphate synthase subunit PDX2 [Citrus sinensis]